MNPEQIKERVEKALEVLKPENIKPTLIEKQKAWLFIKETLLLIYH